jgi:hypothetical protein
MKKYTKEKQHKIVETRNNHSLREINEQAYNHILHIPSLAAVYKVLLEFKKTHKLMSIVEKGDLNVFEYSVEPAISDQTLEILTNKLQDMFKVVNAEIRPYNVTIQMTYKPFTCIVVNKKELDIF